MPSRRFVSVGSKLAAAMLAVMTLMTAYAYFEVSHREREERLEANERGARMLTELFAAGVTAPLSFSDDAGVREHLELLMTSAQVVYGAVWSLSGKEWTGDPVAEKLRKGFVPGKYPNIDGGVRVVRRRDAVVVDQPVVGATGELLGFVRVAFSLEAENAATVAAERRTLSSSLAMGTGMVLVLVAVSRIVVGRPLARLATAAKGIEEGKSVDLKLEANDEVGMLSRAFASMADAIASREARISSRNTDMRRVLDNVAEGLLTVRSDGTISDEHSRILDEWFGAPPQGTHTIVDYFARISPSTAHWFQIGLASLADDCMPVEVILDQMPKRLAHGTRFFQLDYNPIWKECSTETLSEILVVVRDITSSVERERVELEQRETLHIFRRILDDRAGFREFYREASRLLDRIGASASGPVDISRLSRDIHTLKGNTAVYGIESVSSLCHKIETRMLEDGGGISSAETAELREAWGGVKKLYDELNSSDDRIELTQDEYSHHLTTLQVRLPDDAVTIAVRNWANEGAATRLQRIAEQGRSIARRLGKGETLVETRATPANLRLPPAKWANFWSVFAHVLRNTFDHGIETPVERVNMGKLPGGKVEIAIAATKSGVEVRVVDDGRGIAWNKIAERARKLGLPHATQQDLEEALFSDAVSSKDKVTETSGRGIGMGAVREAVRACGGNIVIETSAGRGTMFRFRFPLTMLDAIRHSALPSVA